jgi:hypothetical protein
MERLPLEQPSDREVSVFDRRDFRVIAEGNDAVGLGLPLLEALGVLERVKQRGGRYVAIVDESTGVLVDEAMARAWLERA